MCLASIKKKAMIINVAFLPKLIKWRTNGMMYMCNLSFAAQPPP